MRAYNSGRILARKDVCRRIVDLYGTEWMVIHRARYHALLLDEATRLGVDIHPGCEVQDVEVRPDSTVVRLHDGRTFAGHVVIGADGLWSQMRRSAWQDHTEPSETGDLAYRGTFSADQLKDMRDEGVDELLEASDVQVWMGPGKHVVFYPLNGGTQYNLVLLRPDNLPPNTRTGVGSLDEMRQTFEGWDPRLTRMIAQLDTALKWKLCHCEELETWVKGSIALLGDACHPTLPYQAQGAAMAVEDGLVLGVLLGRLQQSPELTQDGTKQQALNQVLALYERLRKARTTINVQGALNMRDFFHLGDGEEQVWRDGIMREYNESGAWPEGCRWNWGDVGYERSLLGFDLVVDAGGQFDRWREGREA
ncbi:uncharacterized protein LTR77_007873 [Saxophila tyrrhenica]|uniref:FAD-binding domain-containing protein n=1 Tax=Saxophila tyrrhenica TaxID=1690608 RepID=A0AAV9P7A9_9PEZI|nr:hypothetical protein LTR77_007873 [Saxophila tyrrhenica]